MGMDRLSATKSRATRNPCGLVGLGNMGRGLAGNLCRNLPVPVVFDINPAAVEDAVAMGARRADGLGELLDATDTVCLCLPSLAAIRSVYEGSNGILARASDSLLVVDFSTGDPALTRRYGGELARSGATLVDAPMLRNPQAAQDGTLHLLVSGQAEAIARARPVFRAVSERQYEVGRLGNGQTIKLINNAVTIANTVILCEAFTVATAMGIDLTRLEKVLGVSMAASKKLPDVAQRLIHNNHDTSFSTNVSLKDVDLYLRLAAELGAMTPLADATRDILRITTAFGYGQGNVSRVATVLAKLAGTELPGTTGISV